MPKYPILQHFTYEHLPMNLQLISQPICELAIHLAEHLPEGPETKAGLRKLMEAKDCFVRAALVKPKPLGSAIEKVYVFPCPRCGIVDPKDPLRTGVCATCEEEASQ